MVRPDPSVSALGRPGGSAVVCEHLPVDEASAAHVLGLLEGPLGASAHLAA